MSRRQSRVSIDVRQNDTLLEFENFKKKFLLANKHITKLNSHLSVRIEELNAQISDLHIENLRLRASEIALSAQLKKEREKTRGILADAEAATHNFMRQLGLIRKSSNIPHGRPSVPQTEHPVRPSPRARRPVPDPTTSPAPNRVAKPPTVPAVMEDDEGNISDSPGAEPEDEGELGPTPIRRRSKPRASSSRPPRFEVTEPSPPPPPMDMEFEDQLKAGKRRPTRRQSGFLTTSMSITTVTERPPSPAFGSPLRRDAALEQEEEEVVAVIGGIDGQGDDEPEMITQSVTRRERRRKTRDTELELDVVEYGTMKERERKRPRDSILEELAFTGGAAEGKKSRLKDVTNSPPGKLPALDIMTSDRGRLHTPEYDVPSSTTFRNLLSTHTPVATTNTVTAASSSLPTPRSSSPLPSSESSELPAGGRERRARKSVNYAEPKLNTKMRKPDPPPGTTTSKRSSMSTSTSRRSSQTDTAPAPSLTTTTSGSSRSTNSTSTSNETANPSNTAGIKRKKSRTYAPELDDEDSSEGAQADAENGAGGSVRGSSSSSSWVNTEGRRRSVYVSMSTGGSGRRYEGDDGRRHSMAV